MYLITQVPFCPCTCLQELFIQVPLRIGTFLPTLCIGRYLFDQVDTYLHRQIPVCIGRYLFVYVGTFLHRYLFAQVPFWIGTFLYRQIPNCIGTSLHWQVGTILRRYVPFSIGSYLFELVGVPIIEMILFRYFYL